MGERDRLQRYAQSLERTIQNDYHYLKEVIEDFQEKCLMVTPERNVPPGIINDIRELYKEIRNRLTEIKAIEQLLLGKYRQYYHRDPLRDKEIMEIGFAAKNCYSKFEYALREIEAKKRLREEGSASLTSLQVEVSHWFRSKENQVTLLRNLRILSELDYGAPPDSGMEERREVFKDSPRSLTFFILSGEGQTLDPLQSQLRLREHDILERFGENELRGVLTHLRKVSPSEIEKAFKHVMEDPRFLNLKILLLPVYSQKDLEGDILTKLKKTLEEMKEGELRTISI
jgi:hypothetical protein